jgi:hypothetical protein
MTLPLGARRRRSRVSPQFSHLTIAYCQTVRRRRAGSGRTTRATYTTAIFNFPNQPVKVSACPMYATQSCYRGLGLMEPCLDIKCCNDQQLEQVQVANPLATLITSCGNINTQLMEVSRKHVRIVNHFTCLSPRTDTCAIQTEQASPIITTTARLTKRSQRRRACVCVCKISTDIERRRIAVWHWLLLLLDPATVRRYRRGHQAIRACPIPCAPGTCGWVCTAAGLDTYGAS